MLAVVHAAVVLPWVLRTVLASFPRSKAYIPKAAAVLSLRGDDPFLDRCLRGLLRQDYPDYDVFVVVDHCEDPAWRRVRALVGDEPRLLIDVVRERRSTCSLKCGALRQVLENLDPTYEAVAWVDADVVPHPNYLRELIAPLGDARIGCTTGNRWYLPPDAQWGTLVRYLWNAFVVVPMYWNGVVWGGTAAFRTALLRHTDLLDRLALSLSEDSELRAAVDDAGLLAYSVPTLLMTNRESCQLADLLPWLTRQFFLVRTYYRTRPIDKLIRGYWAAGAIWTAAVLTAVVQAAVGDDSATLRPVVAGVGLVIASLLVWTPIMEASVARIRRRRGDDIRWLAGSKVLRLVVAVPLTAAVMVAALVAAGRLRVFRWRGISYEVAGPHQVRMQSYVPYAETTGRIESNAGASTM